MTVCLAAVACAGEDSSPSVVVASDRMVTFGSLVEFEHEVSKARDAFGRILVLQAGDSLAGAEIIRTARQLPEPPTIVADLSQYLANQYLQMRLKVVNQQVFLPRGIGVSEFYNGNLQQVLSPQIVAQLDHQASTFHLGVSLLVIGVDHEGAHIHGIENPGGVFQEYGEIGFHAIGSGTIHAIQSLIENKQYPGLTAAATLYNVVRAKRRSQVAPGVGEDSDFYIVSSDGVRKLSREQIDVVDKLLDDYRSQSTPSDFSTIEECINE